MSAMASDEHEHRWIRMDDEYRFCAACGQDDFTEDPEFDGWIREER